MMTTTTTSLNEEEDSQKNDGKMASVSTGGTDNDNSSNSIIAKMYSLVGILSALSWIATSYVALSFHPDPKFMDCTLRHNLLTMLQAFAFPIPIAFASFRALYTAAKHDRLNSNDTRDGNDSIGRRLNLGVAVASMWLAASTSMAFAPKFAFGYDLYSIRHKVAASLIHGVTAIFALGVSFLSTKTSVGQIIRGVNDSLWKLGPNSKHLSQSRNISLYATGTVGLLWFTILPIVSPHPLATIPTVLGKRLSRPASAFTFLGAIIAYCLKEWNHVDLSSLTSNERSKEEVNCSIRKTLRVGLAIGSGAHLLLIFLKLIGVDGGGWIFPGRGLQEVYPAMISVPFATGVSLTIHAILCFAAFTDNAD